MDIYQLDYILHEPTEDHGWMYRAEIPALQGCCAWGDTEAETLEELRDVARTMLQLRKEKGQALPPEIACRQSFEGSMTVAA